jgi:hypothetical protein
MTVRDTGSLLLVTDGKIVPQALGEGCAKMTLGLAATRSGARETMNQTKCAAVL